MLPGFELWVPPRPSKYADGLPFYDILGSDAQVVQFPVRPGRKITCFSGALAYSSDNLTMHVEQAGNTKTSGRLAGGDSIYMITYTNENEEESNCYVGLTPDYPGVIVPIRMMRTGKLIILKDSFLCATANLNDEMTVIGPASESIQKAGFDLVVQSLEHGELAFITAMGTVIKKTLDEKEQMLVDGDSLLCFESSVQIDARYVGTAGMICCGGRRIYNTQLTGPGTVWMQSWSIDKMRRLYPS